MYPNLMDKLISNAGVGRKVKALMVVDDFGNEVGIVCLFAEDC